MGAEHTAGPWKISPASMKPDQVPVIGITAPGKWVNLAGVYSTKKGDESKANARLIAAAPRLLAALEGMVDAVYCGGDDGSRLREANEAIREAKGGAA